MENIQYVQYNRNREPTTSIEFLGLEAAKQVKSFHESIDIYQPTPLVSWQIWLRSGCTINLC